MLHPPTTDTRTPQEGRGRWDLWFETSTKLEEKEAWARFCIQMELFCNHLIVQKRQGLITKSALGDKKIPLLTVSVWSQLDRAYFTHISFFNLCCSLTTASPCPSDAALHHPGSDSGIESLEVSSQSAVELSSLGVNTSSWGACTSTQGVMNLGPAPHPCLSGNRL